MTCSTGAQLPQARQDRMQGEDGEDVSAAQMEQVPRTSQPSSKG